MGRESVIVSDPEIWRAARRASGTRVPVDTLSDHRRLATP